VCPGSEMWGTKLSLGGNMVLGTMRAEGKMTKGDMVRMGSATLWPWPWVFTIETEVSEASLQYPQRQCKDIAKSLKSNDFTGPAALPLWIPSIETKKCSTQLAHDYTSDPDISMILSFSSLQTYWIWLGISLGLTPYKSQMCLKFYHIHKIFS
jgi:hypothetical protein